MNTIDLSDFEHDPGAFLDRVEAGEHLIVVRGGRPVVELRPVASAPPVAPMRRPIGLAAGEFTVPDDFDAPLPEDILRAFEGQ